jgi:transposase
VHQKVVGTKLSIQAKRPTRQGRPNHPIQFKRRLAEQACEPGVSVAQLALDHGINANLLFKWRRQYRAGQFDAPAKPAMLPVSIIDADVSLPSVPAKLPPAPKAEALPAAETRSAIEVQFADATVRIDSGADVALLRTVLAVLRR